MNVDGNPRPLKRQRTFASGSSSPLSTPPDTLPPNHAQVLSRPPTHSLTPTCLAPLPAQTLLVSLPGILVHPPNHVHYVRSLYLSLSSLRRCLALKVLNPDVECRAWTGLAEIGMKVITGGFSQNTDYQWAQGLEIEVEKAIGKGLLIAQKHPSLRTYRHLLNILSAQFSRWNNNIKFSRSILRRAITNLNHSVPPHVLYTAHLALIENLSSSTIPQDIQAALHAVDAFQAVAINNGHPKVALLACVLKLRISTAAEMWDRVQTALGSAETALGLSYEPAAPGQAPGVEKYEMAAAGTPAPPQESFVFFEDPFEVSMALHTLMIGVIFYTRAGLLSEVTPRLSHLHALLDSDALRKFPTGIVEVPFPSSIPLSVKVTHPRVFYLLGYLVTASARRDPVGRKPKRKSCATEGLAVWEKTLKKELPLPVWASLADAQEVEQRVVAIKADLLCEVIAISIQRSEFDAAEDNLNILIAHTRTYGIFQLYAARITLHHAHLAHALGNSTRALECYKVAAHLAQQDSFVSVAARAGQAALQIGMLYDMDDGEGVRENSEPLSIISEDVRTMGLDAAKICRDMGGILAAIGLIIESSLTTEILKSKNYLKDALSLVTKSQENHLRALVLALVSSHYFHTASDHAQTMLLTCEQLASGLGAASTKVSDKDKKGQTGNVDTIGNAPLRLWIGERFLELYKLTGKDARVMKQLVANRHLLQAVESLAQRGLRISC